MVCFSSSVWCIRLTSFAACQFGTSNTISRIKCNTTLNLDHIICETMDSALHDKLLTRHLLSTTVKQWYHCHMPNDIVFHRLLWLSYPIIVNFCGYTLKAMYIHWTYYFNDPILLCSSYFLSMTNQSKILQLPHYERHGSTYETSHFYIRERHLYSISAISRR